MSRNNLMLLVKNRGARSLSNNYNIINVSKHKTEYSLGNFIKESLRHDVPIGSITQYVGESAPLGWFLCDGGLYYENEYPLLFRIIGARFGGSEGSFNVPNFKGRIGVGYDSVDLNMNRIGSTGGERTHLLTSNEMPTHGHTVTDPGHIHTGTTNSVGEHTHGYTDAFFSENIPGGANNAFGSAGFTDNDNSLITRNATTNSNGNHSHTVAVTNSKSGVTINNTGGNGAHNNMQPYIVVNYIIKY